MQILMLTPMSKTSKVIITGFDAQIIINKVIQYIGAFDYHDNRDYLNGSGIKILKQLRVLSDLNHSEIHDTIVRTLSHINQAAVLNTIEKNTADYLALVINQHTPHNKSFTFVSLDDVKKI